MDTSSSPQLLFAIVAVAFVWQHAMATCHPLLERDKEEEEPRTRGEETFTREFMDSLIFIRALFEGHGIESCR